MKKLILIMLSLVFLSGCVQQFTVEDFSKSMIKMCNDTDLIKDNLSKKSQESEEFKLNNFSKEAIDVIVKGLEISSKTGCSAHITPVSCSLSCGGSDTPKAGTEEGNK